MKNAYWKERLSSSNKISMETTFKSVIHILKNKGFIAQKIDTNVLEIHIEEEVKAHLNISSLHNHINHDNPAHRFDAINEWCDMFIDTLTLPGAHELSDATLIIRAIHKDAIKTSVGVKLSAQEKQDMFDAMCFKDISSELFLSVGQDNENTTSMMSKTALKGVDCWKELGLKNIQSLIGNDYDIKVTKDSELICFQTDIENLFLTLPMSKIHNQKIAEALNTETDNIVYFFVHELNVGHAFKKGDKNALSKFLNIIKQNDFRIPIFYHIAKDGILEEFDIDRMIKLADKSP